MPSLPQLIDTYLAGVPTLRQAVAGLTRQQLLARPVPGKWSTLEVVCHLADFDPILADRMKRVIAEDRPTLQAFDENAWIDRLDAQAMPVEEAVNLFVANRHWMTRILKACPEADFARVGVHTEAGPQTLAQVVVTITNHVDHHLKFLYAKRGHLGVSIYPRFTRE